MARGTAARAGRSRLAEVALVDGEAAAVIAVTGHLQIAIAFEVEADGILADDVVADPRLANLDITLGEAS